MHMNRLRAFARPALAACLLLAALPAAAQHTAPAPGSGAAAVGEEPEGVQVVTVGLHVGGAERWGQNGSATLRPRHPRIDGTIPASGKHGAASQLATKRIISASSCGPINNAAGQ